MSASVMTTGDAHAGARRDGRRPDRSGRRDRRRGGLRLVQRPAGARVGRPGHGAVQGHRPHRPVGVRQVDLPPHPQPDARGGPRAQLAGTVKLDGVDIYGPGQRAVDTRRHIGMVFQKPNPFPAMTIADNVLSGLKFSRIIAVQPGRPGRGDADQGRAVERGQGPARRARRGALGRPAAAPVHRPGAGRPAPGAAHGRALLRPRPDVHAPHRAHHQGDRPRGHGGHRHPQHAAGPAGVRLLRLLPGGGEPARPGRRVGSPPRSCSATPPIRGPPTMSMASSAEPAAAAFPPGSLRSSWCRRRAVRGARRPGCGPCCRPVPIPSLQSTGSSFAGPAIQQWAGPGGHRPTGLNINFQVSTSVIGAQRLRPEPGRLRRLRHPVQHRPEPAGPVPALRVPPRRRRRAGHYVQPHQPEHRAAGHRRQPQRPGHRQHLPRQGHHLEPAERQRGQPRAGRHHDTHRRHLPVRRRRRELSALRLPLERGQQHVRGRSARVRIEHHRTVVCRQPQRHLAHAGMREHGGLRVEPAAGLPGLDARGRARPVPRGPTPPPTTRWPRTGPSPMWRRPTPRRTSCRWPTC